MFSQLIDTIKTVYRGASKGRGLVTSPKGMTLRIPPLLLLILRIVLDYSTRYRC